MGSLKMTKLKGSAIESPERYFRYGYDHTYVKWNKAVRPDFSIKIKEIPSDQSKRPMGVRHTIFYCEDSSLPTPDLDDTEFLIKSITHRVGKVRPRINPRLMNDLYHFTTRVVKEKMAKGSLTELEDIPTIKEWLANSNYNNMRKRQILDASEGIEHPFDAFPEKGDCFSHVDGFPKMESYEASEFKAARAIMPKPDYAKACMGPIFYAIDKSIGIKAICKSDKPGEIRDKIKKWHEDGNYGFEFMETDYSSWESSQGPSLMKATEWPLYKAICGPYWKEVKRLANTLLGINKIHFKDFVAYIQGTRMSGEMNTSLANTWNNYIICRFVAARSGIRDIKSFHVGDDGLIRTKKGCRFNMDLFEELGLEIKANYQDELYLCNLCKLHYFPSGSVVRDFRPVLAKIGWFNKKFNNSRLKIHDELLVSKAVCFLFLTKNCPVIGPLCVKIVKEYKVGAERILRRLNSDAEFSYLKQMVNPKLIVNSVYKDLEEFKPKPTAEDRELYATLFDISPSTQIEMENMDVRKPFSFRDYGVQVPEAWTVYNENHVSKGKIKVNETKFFDQLRKEFKRANKADVAISVIKILFKFGLV